ncbi:MAG: NifU family protein [Mycobacterium sp.]
MTDDGRWRGAGERIQQLLDAVSSPAVTGAAARDRAEQLVAEVAGLYGAALQRIVALSDDTTIARYAADDLVASVLLVHGLHPDDVGRRAADALDRVRPYLGSHGGDIELIEVTDEGVVRLRFAGSCRSCPSSAVTLQLAVEDALRAAAPEVTEIELVAEPAVDGVLPTIPADSLFEPVRSRGTTAWHPVPTIAALASGEVGGFDVDGVAVLACRVEDTFLAYRDHCPCCGDTLAGAVLHRGLGASDPVLRCPRCRTPFDVVHAGLGCDGADVSLEPVPMLVRDGVLCLAVPARRTEFSV